MNESCDNQVHDIVMQALNEAQIHPAHDLEELKRQLAEEQAKNKQLMANLKNQYSKISRLRKTYHHQLQEAENEQFRASQAKQQLWEEKMSLQKSIDSKDNQIVVLTSQLEVYKSEIGAYKNDAQYFEKLASERDRSLGNLKTELKAIETKLSDLIMIGWKAQLCT